MNILTRPRNPVLAAATFVFLGCVHLSAAQIPAEDLTLTDAVAAELSNNPSMRSASLGVELADKRIAERRAERLPAVTLSETLTRSNNPVFVFGSLLEQARFGPQNF